MKFLRRRKDIEIEELDITSLLDVLVILLVFLLQNMSNSELTLDLVRELALPYSKSRGVSENGVVVQVNAAKEVYLNNKVIGVLETGGGFSQDIVNQLNTVVEETKLLSEQKEKGKPLLINLVLDKTLDYAIIDKLLKSSAKSGFTQFKFIVQGVE